MAIDLNKYKLASTSAPTNLDKYKLAPTSTISETPSESIWSKLAHTDLNPLSLVTKGVFKVGKALTPSEQAFGQDISSGIIGNTQNKQLEQQNKTLSDSDLNNIKTIIGLKNKAIANGQDSSHFDNVLRNYQMNDGQSLSDIAPALDKSNLQVLGDAGGTLLDILSAGSYGTEAKSFELLKATKATEPIVNQGLKQTLKTITKETAVHSAVGGASGYGYDVANNLQDGATGADIFKPGMGTVTGVATPIVIGGVRVGVAITKETAPRFINSLIKPKTADFSYGKDPGRTVSELGITGNNLNDFGEKIDVHKADIGTRIGEVYDNPINSSLRINAEDEIKKIDDAIAEAAKGGKSNQSIVTALQNTKDALLYEHQVNADGVIEKIGTTPRDLSSLSPKEGFDLKQLVSDNTRFNGTPSDDKKVNSILKNIYGSITEKLNTAVGKNNPEITDLNQKYADLTSASLAVRNRDAIVKKSNLISAPIKVGTAAGIISAFATGGAAIPAILLGATAAAVDKALESTAVKTRVASWLGSAEPSVINKILEKNPGLRTVFYRLVPKLGSRLGK